MALAAFLRRRCGERRGRGASLGKRREDALRRHGNAAESSGQPEFCRVWKKLGGFLLMPGPQHLCWHVLNNAVVQMK